MEYLIGTVENTLPAKKSVVFFFLETINQRKKLKTSEPSNGIVAIPEVTQGVSN